MRSAHPGMTTVNVWKSLLRFDRVQTSRNLPSRLAREGSVATETSNARGSDGAATPAQAARDGSS